MTYICIIRHGQTDWNKEGRIQGKSDIPLNETGRLQAKNCAHFLHGEAWDVIITSPLIRAKRTAEIVNETLNLPLIEMQSFVERSYGVAEGMTREERKATYPTRDYPEQEPRTPFHRRVMNGLEEIRTNYLDKKVLLIAHGGVINAILANLSNGELGSGKTRLSHAGMSYLHFQENQWTIEAYNQINHLKNEVRHS